MTRHFRVNGSYIATYPGGHTKRGKYKNKTVTAEFPQYAMRIVAEAAIKKYGYVDFKWLTVWAEEIEGEGG